MECRTSLSMRERYITGIKSVKKRFDTIANEPLLADANFTHVLGEIKRGARKGEGRRREGGGEEWGKEKREREKIGGENEKRGRIDWVCLDCNKISLTMGTLSRTSFSLGRCLMNFLF